MTNHPLQMLVVDDDNSWQRIYRFYLESEEVIVEAATSKNDALKAVNQKAFDIAVVDLRLVADDDTNFEGLDVANHIRQISPKTRIVIKSGYTDDVKIKLELEKLKPDGVFDKGKPIEDFVDTVRNIIGALKNLKTEEGHE